MNPLLRMAVLAGADKAVSLHLNRAPDLDAADENGMTLLMFAAIRGHNETCRILLEAGANPLLNNFDGLSALCLARANGHIETVNTICSYFDEFPKEHDTQSVTDNVNESFSTDQHSETGSPEPGLLDDWEEEPDSAIPENDYSLFIGSSDVQHMITSHQPLDLDEDWMDIDVELPDFTWAHAKSYLLHDCLQIERNLLLHAISSGRLVSWQIDAMAELAEDEPDGYSENLQEVLHDLGVRIDSLSCDYVHPCSLDQLDLADDEPDVQLVEEAIRFLWEKKNPAHDPYWIYMRDVRSFSLLTAREEIDFGRMADEGSREMLQAAAYFPPAIAELIAIVKAGDCNIIAGTSSQSRDEDLFPEEDGMVDEFTEGHTDDIGDESEASYYHNEQQRAELISRIDSVNSLLAEVIRMNNAGSRDSDEYKQQILLIHDELIGFRFSTDVLYKLMDLIDGYWRMLQQSIDRVLMICVNTAGMSQKVFRELFHGNETNLDWCRNIISGQKDLLASAIALHSNEIADEQIRLINLEKDLGMPLSDFGKLCGMLKDGERKLRRARHHMTMSNLRLAHHIATKYKSSGMPLSDLVQEANIGLLKAVERFDYRRGFRFSTFATWWIRQSVTRAIADKSRSIRIPVHVVESLAKIKRATIELEAVGGGTVTPEDIAELAELPLEKVRKILNLPEEPCSIDALEEETPGFIESLAEREDTDPEVETLEADCSETIAHVLATLTQKEEKIIRMRFGFGEEKPHTLEEIGLCFNVTRERIRQIEAKALRNLRHPSRSKRLKVFVS